jgi:hypothetical protein
MDDVLGIEINGFYKEAIETSIPFHKVFLSFIYN